MLKIITMLTLLATSLLAKAQVTENRSIGHFSKIEITDGVQLALTQSSQMSLTAEAASAAELANLITEVKDNTLKIYTTVGASPKMKVYLSAQDLKAIKADGPSLIAVTNSLEADQMSLSLASGAIFSGNVTNTGKMDLTLKSGSFYNGTIETDSIVGNFSQNAKANLGGHAANAKIEAKSGAVCTSKDFESDRISVYASGFASVLLNPEGQSEIAIDGNASVRYSGTPQTANLQDGLVLQNTDNNAPKGN